MDQIEVRAFAERQADYNTDERGSESDQNCAHEKEKRKSRPFFCSIKAMQKSDNKNGIEAHKQIDAAACFCNHHIAPDGRIGCARPIKMQAEKMFQCFRVGVKSPFSLGGQENISGGGKRGAQKIDRRKPQSPSAFHAIPPLSLIGPHYSTRIIVCQ